MERHELNENLDTAIAESAFQLYYQPIVDLRTGDLVAFEALVRWPHDRRGMVLPDEFIALAEESGQIVPLGAWILERAAQEAAAWHAASSATRAAAGRPRSGSTSTSPPASSATPASSTSSAAPCTPPASTRTPSSSNSPNPS